MSSIEDIAGALNGGVLGIQGADLGNRAAVAEEARQELEYIRDRLEGSDGQTEPDACGVDFELGDIDRHAEAISDAVGADSNIARSAAELALASSRASSAAETARRQLGMLAATLGNLQYHASLAADLEVTLREETAVYLQRVGVEPAFNVIQ